MHEVDLEKSVCWLKLEATQQRGLLIKYIKIDPVHIASLVDMTIFLTELKTKKLVFTAQFFLLFLTCLHHFPSGRSYWDII